MGTAFYPNIDSYTSPYLPSTPLHCDTKSWINDALNDSYTFSGGNSRASLPLDAPIQQRTYVTPSSTSRKTIPARFAKHFSKAEKYGSWHGSSDRDSSDGSKEGTPPHSPDPYLIQQIKERRRKNAISARKSRQKKLEQMEELEKERNNLLNLVHDYRDHVLQLHAILQNRGIPFTAPAFMRIS